MTRFIITMRFLQLRRKVCSGLLMESMEITLMYMIAVRIIIMHCFPIMIKMDLSRRCI